MRAAVRAAVQDQTAPASKTNLGRHGRRRDAVGWSAKWRTAVSASRCLRMAQARRAAVPFKSVLAEAAVGEVLLFFSVEVGMTRTE